MDVFKAKYSLEKRKRISESIRTNYPEHVGVVISKASNSKNDQDIELARTNFLVHKDTQFSTFQLSIKEQVQLGPTVSLFFFINNTVPSSGETMGILHEKYKENDGFLYVKVAKENCFGTQEICVCTIC